MSGRQSTSGAIEAECAVKHKKYSDMAIGAIRALDDRNGSSRNEILKHILSKSNVGSDRKSFDSHIKHGLRRAVARGQLKRTKGQGYRLTERAVKAQVVDRPDVEKKTKIENKVKKLEPKAADQSSNISALKPSLKKRSSIGSNKRDIHSKSKTDKQLIQSYVNSYFKK